VNQIKAGQIFAYLLYTVHYCLFLPKLLNMELVLITIALLALAVAGIAIKIWGKKDGKFAGTCASQSPFLNKEGEACSYCGKLPDEAKDCDEPQTVK
jgi:hypothetical protein